MARPLDIEVERYDYPETPAHHVLASDQSQSWAAYLASFTTSSSGSTPKRKPLSRTSSLLSVKGRKSRQTSRESSLERQPDQPVESNRSFRNPWPSWHKPSSAEVWKAFEWGEDRDPCIEIAKARLADEKSGGSNGPLKTTQEQAAQLLHLERPDFKFNTKNEKVKVTWLGHAGMLVQLSPLQEGLRPVRCLLDPIFSLRCSPNQNFGPMRSYPPPCKVEDLPEIDVFMMSHNHYDHLDYDTVLELWARNKSTIRFVVPLGNRQWFIDCGVDAERVVELDWWDAASLQPSKGDSLPFKITCTPAQHNSGRSGPADADTTLWSSWYIEHGLPDGKIHRIYFAGDTGYQFHDDPTWPPTPPRDSGDSSVQTSRRRFRFRRKQSPSQTDRDEDKKWPECPAFKDIASRLGRPDVLMLPVSVGATYDYLRSFSGLPDSWNVIPRHNPGVTAHNHMPPWDAVRVFRAMTDSGSEEGQEGAPVAIAMHWGTFVTDPIEVLKTLGQLEWACEAHGITFCRSLNEGAEDEKTSRRFLAVHHGESIVL